MPIPILMPALSPTMNEGNLARWLKKEGDVVKAGDVLAEIESDKATVELEAPAAGTLGKLLVSDGAEAVKVNATIAILLAEGETMSALDTSAATPAGEPSKPKAPPSSAVNGAAPPPSPAASRAVDGNGRIFASPLARRNARSAGIELDGIAGSGPHGRILRADVERAIASGRPRTSQPSASTGATASGPNYTEVPLSSMRKTIARRLVEASQTIPHFYLGIECEVDKLLALRREVNDHSDHKLSVNDFVIRAVALALRKVPAANASFTDTAIRLYGDVDISMAVATPEGLITPIIRNADRKGVAAIAAESKELVAKARAGKLKPEEYQGGTFTISNLGMYGVREFAAIINPPQSCILAVGAAVRQAVVRDDGSLAAATVMSLTLSVDHRVVDGAVGAELLAALKTLIEQPLTMLL
ncbi:pyruvate dehydrogenase complex dihydrolipoamide acetyltransferase [Xanthobacteraceae bacterium Astr-EGSB]|uniref:pyruvate dehydrogenase complex dihydrolipoamide acetyltransferase n=1 Tax=Astrobacterium formosum TaxID=3069710 RepID=UPI0027ADFDE9|nr:pyruvate dehydrogenase complex dihydrolipoamide acetyltransferase [Xanthobacteraceae bacterium Astr-EGSB]